MYINSIKQKEKTKQYNKKIDKHDLPNKITVNIISASICCPINFTNFISTKISIHEFKLNHRSINIYMLIVYWRIKYVM